MDVIVPIAQLGQGEPNAKENGEGVEDEKEEQQEVLVIHEI